MEKVICERCKEIGYTASPQSMLCQCGEKLTVITDFYQKFEVKDHCIENKRRHEFIDPAKRACKESLRMEESEYENLAYFA